jgi:hypothetical protein
MFFRQRARQMPIIANALQSLYSLAFACIVCYTVAMKTSIQQAAAKSLIHQAITASTAGQAQIFAQAAAALDPSVNPNKVQEIWLAKFSQTKKAGK